VLNKATGRRFCSPPFPQTGVPKTRLSRASTRAVKKVAWIGVVGKGGDFVPTYRGRSGGTWHREKPQPLLGFAKAGLQLARAGLVLKAQRLGYKSLEAQDFFWRNVRERSLAPVRRSGRRS
jgi:hypothetical protein